MEIKNDYRNCSKNYIYILLTAGFFILKSCTINLNEISIDTQKNIFGIQVIIYNHILMKLLLEYFGYIIFGILAIIFVKHKEIKKISNHKEKILFSIKDISKDSKARKILLISCTFFGIQLIARSILFFCSTWILDMWIFNIIFIALFMKYILKYPIFKHQLYALAINFFINIILLLVASAIKKNGISPYDSIINMYGSFLYIILFYIIYLILSALICSSEVLQKQLMELHYVSPFIIIFVFGMICALLNFIFLIITTNVSCGEYLTSHNICTISYQNYENNETFFENFNIFINEMGDRFNQDKTAFFLEIFLVYPFYSFTSFMKYFYEILIIFYLNPISVLFSDNIYYGLKLLIMIIYDFSDIGTHLRFLGQIISIIAYLFYLEIFVIKCFGFNQNIKKNISNRANTESQVEIIIDEYVDDNDDSSMNTSKEEEPKNTEMVNLGDYIITI